LNRNEEIKHGINLVNYLLANAKHRDTIENPDKEGEDFFSFHLRAIKKLLESLIEKE